MIPGINDTCVNSGIYWMMILKQSFDVNSGLLKWYFDTKCVNGGLLNDDILIKTKWYLCQWWFIEWWYFD